MTRCVPILTLAALALSSPAVSAPSARLKVDGKGTLRISAETLRKLGVKPDRDGAIWLEFPPAPTPRPKVAVPLALPRTVRPSPLRVLTPVDKGVAILPRTRIDGKTFLPGPPGTVFVATGSTHTVRLKKP